jgi:hypothetical protein
VLRKTSPEVVAEIDRLLDDHTEKEITGLLTERGFRSGTGKRIDSMMVMRVRRRYGLTPRFQRLRARGLLTLDEVAQRFGICTSTAKEWRWASLLRAHAYNDKPEYLFEHPGDDPPTRYTWKGLSTWARQRRSATQPISEVQYAT